MSDTKLFILAAFIFGMVGVYSTEKNKKMNNSIQTISIDYDHRSYEKFHNSQCEICKHKNNQ